MTGTIHGNESLLFKYLIESIITDMKFQIKVIKVK